MLTVSARVNMAAFTFWATQKRFFFLNFTSKLVSEDLVVWSRLLCCMTGSTHRVQKYIQSCMYGEKQQMHLLVRTQSIWSQSNVADSEVHYSFTWWGSSSLPQGHLLWVDRLMMNVRAELIFPLHSIHKRQSICGRRAPHIDREKKNMGVAPPKKKSADDDLASGGS